MTAPEVSIIIVNYNSGALLSKCIRSLKEYVRSKFEIIVVDNASTDDSVVSLYPDQQMKIIRNDGNFGFSKACNIGANASKGTVLHFLNPDAQVTANIHLCYAEAICDPRHIFVTQIEDLNRGGFRSGYPLPTLKNIWRLFVDPKSVERWYLGASVALQRTLFQELGGWSEDYFLYAEDMDFFFKAAIAGIGVRVSDALVIHEQGGITSKIWSSRERQLRVERSALIFVRKFGLQLDYFVFRHLAFIKMLFKRPMDSIAELVIYWKLLLKD